MPRSSLWKLCSPRPYGAGLDGAGGDGIRHDRATISTITRMVNRKGRHQGRVYVRTTTRRNVSCGTTTSGMGQNGPCSERYHVDAEKSSVRFEMQSEVLGRRARPPVQNYYLDGRRSLVPHRAVCERLTSLEGRGRTTQHGRTYYLLR